MGERKKKKKTEQENIHIKPKKKTVHFVYNVSGELIL